MIACVRYLASLDYYYGVAQIRILSKLVLWSTIWRKSGMPVDKFIGHHTRFWYLLQCRAAKTRASLRKYQSMGLDEDTDQNLDQLYSRRIRQHMHLKNAFKQKQTG